MENDYIIKRTSGLWAAIVFVMISCNNQTGNNTTQDTLQQSTDTATTITISKGIHCFAYTQNNDTVFLSLTITGKLATGKMMYNLYEKDKSIGAINGVFYGDTLLANYSFLSEGNQSVRQIIFLRKGNIFLEGTGSMREENGRLVFINTADIVFTGTHILSLVDCAVSKRKDD